MFSTVGDARVFERLPLGPVKPALALSLHSPGPTFVRELLPRAPRIDPTDLVMLGERYAQATGYPIQYQWTLLEGINDSDDEVDRIAALLAGKYAVVNFIPYNAVEGSSFRRPSWSAPPRWRARCIGGRARQAPAVGRAGRRRRLRAVAGAGSRTTR